MPDQKCGPADGARPTTPSGARALLYRAHLASNIALARRLAGSDAQLVVPVKANAYGHGLDCLARPLAGLADMLAVSSIEEAVQLRNLGVDTPVLLFKGCYGNTSIALAQRLKLSLVAHTSEQVDELIAANWQGQVWLKAETGMHRLGLDADAWRVHAYRLQERGINWLAMQHYACANTPEHPLNAQQQQVFIELTKEFSRPVSAANSAALCSHLPGIGQRLFIGDWVRPGLMIYGASPLDGIDAARLGLLPVMRLESQIIAVKPIARGQSSGYGAIWHAPRDGWIALVACGYGDGYPRELAPGAWATCQGRRLPLVGRVSMDMLCLWLGNKPVEQGSSVELWGTSPTVDQVANWAGTISYSLLTRVADRVERALID